MKTLRTGSSCPWGRWESLWDRPVTSPLRVYHEVWDAYCNRGPLQGSWGLQIDPELCFAKCSQSQVCFLSLGIKHLFPSQRSFYMLYLYVVYVLPFYSEESGPWEKSSHWSPSINLSSQRPSPTLSPGEFYIGSAQPHRWIVFSSWQLAW